MFKYFYVIVVIMLAVWLLAGVQTEDKPEKQVQKRILDFSAFHRFRFKSEYHAERRDKLNNRMKTTTRATLAATTPRISAKGMQIWLYVMGHYFL
jgi:hypothetical protein